MFTTYLTVGLSNLTRSRIAAEQEMGRLPHRTEDAVTKLIREALDARRAAAKQARESVDEQGIPY